MITTHFSLDPTALRIQVTKLVAVLNISDEKVKRDGNNNYCNE